LPCIKFFQFDCLNKGAVQNSYPYHLAHGVSRFDYVRRASLNINNSYDPKLDIWHYFEGIRTMLEESGFDVYHKPNK
jgi:hypothetical protein